MRAPAKPAGTTLRFVTSPPQHKSLIVKLGLRGSYGCLCLTVCVFSYLLVDCALCLIVPHSVISQAPSLSSSGQLLVFNRFLRISAVHCLCQQFKLPTNGSARAAAATEARQRTASGVHAPGQPPLPPAFGAEHADAHLAESPAKAPLLGRSAAEAGHDGPAAIGSPALATPGSSAGEASDSVLLPAGSMCSGHAACNGAVLQSSTSLLILNLLSEHAEFQARSCCARHGIQVAAELMFAAVDVCT